MANDRNIHAPPAEFIRPEDPLRVSERVAAAAFLAGHSGGTRVSYTTDLRIFAEWCHDRASPGRSHDCVRSTDTQSLWTHRSRPMNQPAYWISSASACSTAIRTNASSE